MDADVLCATEYTVNSVCGLSTGCSLNLLGLLEHKRKVLHFYKPHW